MERIPLILFMAVMVAGCTSPRISSTLSSGIIGCPSDEIKISDEKAFGSVHEWVAECRGKRYICSYTYGSNTNCKENP